jgi:hypothetical protein
MADTSSKPAITYMETVDKRDAATLLPIIQRVVKPGTIIHSDQWKAYHNISSRLQLSHGTVLSTFFHLGNWVVDVMTHLSSL